MDPLKEAQRVHLLGTDTITFNLNKEELTFFGASDHWNVTLSFCISLLCPVKRNALDANCSQMWPHIRINLLKHIPGFCCWISFPEEFQWVQVLAFLTTFQRIMMPMIYCSSIAKLESFIGSSCICCFIYTPLI